MRILQGPIGALQLAALAALLILGGRIRAEDVSEPTPRPDSTKPAASAATARAEDPASCPPTVQTATAKKPSKKRARKKARTPVPATTAETTSPPGAGAPGYAAPNDEAGRPVRNPACPPCAGTYRALGAAEAPPFDPYFDAPPFMPFPPAYPPPPRPYPPPWANPSAYPSGPPYYPVPWWRPQAAYRPVFFHGPAYGWPGYGLPTYRLSGYDWPGYDWPGHDHAPRFIGDATPPGNPLAWHAHPMQGYPSWIDHTIPPGAWSYYDPWGWSQAGWPGYAAPPLRPTPYGWR